MPKYGLTRIKDMQPGRGVDCFCVLDKASTRIASNGSPYLVCTIKDKTGSIDAKMWDYSGDIHQSVGSIVKVRGTVDEYNGSSQLTIAQIRLANKDSDGFDIRDISPSAPMDADAGIGEILATMCLVGDGVYSKIANHIYSKFSEEFAAHPAAKTHHHAFIGGLMMHTGNMLKLAKAAAEVYGDFIDRDLLLSGVFLHDIAKIREMLVGDSGLVSEYSLEGSLVGHLVMGSELIDAAANEIGVPRDTPEVLMLKNMILSHHGKPEYGAAAVPMTAEAEILSQLDMLDARAEMCREAMQDVEPGTMTDYSKGLGHPLYVHRNSNPESKTDA